MVYLSVIIPAFNEAENIKKNTRNFLSYLSKQDYESELIIVNDGSGDSTEAIAKSLSQENKNIRILEHGKNQGKGAAVKTGALAAKGDYLLFLDADGATAIEHVELIWPAFNSGAEVVIGSRDPRDIPGAKIEIAQNRWKQFLGKAGNFLIQGLTGLPYRDTQCGFKAFTKKAAKDIFPRLKTKRWAFDVEILLLAKQFDYKIGIIPVIWKNAGPSRVKLSGYAAALGEIVLIKTRLLRNKF